MNEFDLLIDLHRNQKRQGPGSKSTTEKAISLTGLKVGSKLNIVDIGCGTGGQTLVLARNLDGQITAVDLFPEFLAELNSRSAAEGMGDKITTLESSMENLNFGQGTLDLIWSEGAIYLMGFEKGITCWRPFLREKGWLAVSDITWTTPERPLELEEFWKQECPEIDILENKLKVIEQCGFKVVDHFILPESDWLENYYAPLEESYPEFLSRHSQSKEVLELVEEYRQEAKFYKKYCSYYSYGFYIAQKI